MPGPDGVPYVFASGDQAGSGDIPGLVVAGGEVEDLAWLRAEALAARVVVAADRGAVALVAAGVVPHVLVGDLDSIDAATFARLEAAGVPVERHAADKDATDLALAIDAAVARGATRLRVAGALRPAPGGEPRLDHLWGNLAALAGAARRRATVASRSRAGRVADARLVAPDAEVVIVTGPGGCDLVGTVGDHVTLVPLDRQVDGTTTSGLRWPLSGEALPWGTTRGVSNEMSAPRARVEVASGHLLVAWQRRGGLGELACPPPPGARP